MPDIQAEYRIIQSAAGWTDRSGRGRLRFDGPDAAGFLQGLLTNDIAALGPGRGVYAALLTPQGRMVADFRIYNRTDHFVADVAPGAAADLSAKLDALIFAEDLQVKDISSATAVVSVAGLGASSSVARATDLEPDALDALAVLAQVDAGAGMFVIRADEAEWPMFDIWMPAGERDAVVARLEEAGAAEVSAGLFDVLRIEAARPAFGVDMTPETIPLEAGLLDRAISTTKGCYVGQEVIIRVLHRGGGRVAKRLVQVAFDAEGDVAAGQRLGERPVPGQVEGPASAGPAPARDIGRITSVAFSPQAGRTLALAYVARDLAEVGNQVVADTPTGQVAGEIVRMAG